jgi:serine/threonine protein kinase
MTYTQTFYDFIEKDGVTLDVILSIIKKLCDTLINLQEEHELCHYDLHGSNILVSSDGSKCYIIDWGRASFTIEGERYMGYSDERYQGRYEKDDIVTGAVDIYFLLNGIRFTAKNRHIRQWAKYMRRHLFSNVFYKTTNEFITNDDMTNVNVDEKTNAKGELIINNQYFDEAPWLFNFLGSIESKHAQRNEIHRLNVKALNKLTYRFLYDKMLLLTEEMNTELARQAELERLQNQFRYSLINPLSSIAFNPYRTYGEYFKFLKGQGRKSRLKRMRKHARKSRIYLK